MNKELVGTLAPIPQLICQLHGRPQLTCYLTNIIVAPTGLNGGTPEDRVE